MATPLIDFISVALSRRIADAVATGATDGGTLTASERMDYINKAMFKLINDYWAKCGGDIQAFINEFPELVTAPVTITLTSTGLYVFANPNLHYFKFVGANLATIKISDTPLSYLTVTTYVTVFPETQYSNIISQRTPQNIPTTSNPIAIPLDNAIQFFPQDGTLTTANIIFIQQPLNPTTGAYLTEGGAYDSPFLPFRNETIAELAEQIYRAEAQQEA